MSYVVPIRPAALPAWRALNDALAAVEYDVPCEGRPDVWCAESPTPELVEYAERRCQLCPVRRECGAYADVANERNAVWGGTYRAAKVGRPATTNRTEERSA